jgi:hypothetical protein
MSQAPVSAQGSRVSFDQQVDFKTPNVAGLKDWRPEGEPTIATFADVSQTPNPHFRDPNQKAKPITYGEPVEDAFVIPTLTYQAASTGGTSSIVQAFESGGWTVESGDDTTSTGTPTASAIDMTADNVDAGVCSAFQMPSGKYEIALCADDDGTTFVPAMALSAAPTSGHAIKKCFTITPGDESMITETKYLTMLGVARALDGANNVTVKGTGCAMASVEDFVMEVGTLPPWVFHFNAGDLSQDIAASLGDNDFADAEPTFVWDDPIFNFADANSAGAIAHTCEDIIKATFRPGHSVERAISQGCTTNLNNTAGYLKVIGDAEFEIEMYWSVDRLDEWQGSNTSKYIAIQRTGASALTPALFICMPNAHIMDPPEINLIDAPPNFARITVKYVGRPAGFESIVTAGATENAQCYIGISDRSS